MVRIASEDGGRVEWDGSGYVADDLEKQLAFFFDILISHALVEDALVRTRSVCKACIATKNNKIKVTANL